MPPVILSNKLKKNAPGKGQVGLKNPTWPVESEKEHKKLAKKTGDDKKKTRAVLTNIVDAFFTACEDDNDMAAALIHSAIAGSNRAEEIDKLTYDPTYLSAMYEFVEIVIRSLDLRFNRTPKPITRAKLIDALSKGVAGVYATLAHSFSSVGSGVLDRVKRFMSTLTKRAKKSLSLSEKMPGESPKSKMGRWAWPQNRGRNQKGEMPFEPSTEVENDLLDAIDEHFSGTPLDEESAALLRFFLKKGQYSDVIHEPNVSIVYRGLEVPNAWLAKILGYSSVAELPKKGTVEKKFTFRPKVGGATSWSIDKKQSVKFAGGMTAQYHSYPGSSKSKDSGLLMYASVEDNPYRFASGPGGLYKLSAAQHYSDEKEAIGLGPIKVYKIEFVRFDDGVPDPEKKSTKTKSKPFKPYNPKFKP